jgi:hypothetical protein
MNEVNIPPMRLLDGGGMVKAGDALDPLDPKNQALAIEQLRLAIGFGVNGTVTLTEFAANALLQALQRENPGYERALKICEEAGIRVVQSSDEGTMGRWDWISSIDASDVSLDTEQDAAEEAVKAAFPEVDWRYQVGNGDTSAGYWDWALSMAQSFAEDEAPMAVKPLLGEGS